MEVAQLPIVASASAVPAQNPVVEDGVLVSAQVPPLAQNLVAGDGALAGCPSATSRTT